jgi:hypothetical protein
MKEFNSQISFFDGAVVVNVLYHIFKQMLEECE